MKRGGKKRAPADGANGSGTAVVPPPLPEKIAQLAHRYWEAEGRPDGKHLEHWFRAEAELTAGEPGGAQAE